MKFMVNEIQHMNPVTNKGPHYETQVKPSDPIDEIGLKKEEPRMGPPTPWTPNQDKHVSQMIRRRFTKLQVPMTQVFKQLREANILACEIPKEGNKLKKYDPNAQCEYHMGQPSHSTEGCWRLKNKVQDMIDA